MLSTLQVQGGYVAAGVGMRNLGHGTIGINGLPATATVYKAYLFWDVLGDAAPSLAQGNFAGSPITGTSLGSGPSPCWPATSNFAYYADVTNLVSGNGQYALDGFASGATDGSDPWNVGSPVPEDEGASLVVVFQDPSSPLTTVQLYGGASELSSGEIDQPLAGFGTVSANAAAATTFIVADGQSASDGPTSFNGHPLSPSEFQGSDPQAVPAYSLGNLWDTQTADVSSFLSPGDTSATATIKTASDCLVWVGQVFSVTSSATDVGAPDAVDALGLDSSAVVTWDPPVDPGTSEITGYRVTTIDDSTGEVVDDETTCGDCYSLTVPNLVNGTSYHVAVAAVTTAGTGPAASSGSTIAEPTNTPDADLGDPTGIGFDLGDPPDEVGSVDVSAQPDDTVILSGDDDLKTPGDTQPSGETTTAAQPLESSDFSDTDGTIQTEPTVDGITSTGFVPPDPNIAAGATQIVETVNDSYDIYDKATKAAIFKKPKSLYGLFNITPQYTPPPDNQLINRITDPRVLYDLRAKRFFISCFIVDDSAQTSHQLIAVSKSSDAQGDWWEYHYPNTVNTGTQKNPAFEYGDRPHLGLDKTGLYITVNDAPFGKSIVVDSRMYLYNKHDLMSGVRKAPYRSHPLVVNDKNPNTPKHPIDVQPADTLGRGADEYMVSAWEAGSSSVPMTSLELWWVTGAGGNSGPTLHKIAVGVPGYWQESKDAPQKGTTTRVDVNVNSNRIDSAVLKDGHLYTAQTTAATNPKRGSAIRFYDITTGTRNLAMTHQFSAPNNWLFNPAVAPYVDQDVVVLTYQFTGPNVYPGDSYITRTLQTVKNQQVETWDAHPAGMASGSGDILDGRSGDYSGAAPDPAGGKVWLVNEYGTGGCDGVKQPQKNCGADWNTALIGR